MSGDETTVEAQRLGDRIRKAREMMDFVGPILGSVDPQNVKDLLTKLLTFAKGDTFSGILDLLRTAIGFAGEKGAPLLAIIDKIAEIIGGISIQEASTQAVDEVPTDADLDAAVAQMANEPTAQFDVAGTLAIVKLIFDVIRAWRNRATA